MSTESPTTKQKATPQKVEPKVQTIKSVYGRMVDPHTGVEYNLIPSVLFQRTSWVDCQLDAGKLELC